MCTVRGNTMGLSICHTQLVSIAITDIVLLTAAEFNCDYTEEIVITNESHENKKQVQTPSSILTLFTFISYHMTTYLDFTKILANKLT